MTEKLGTSPFFGGRLSSETKLKQLSSMVLNKCLFIYTAHHLCDEADVIFAEDLNLKAMSAGMLSKHTLDAGFGQFLNILNHVCFKRGKHFSKVDPNGTSQICPNCGTHTGKKELSERVHECSECGYKTDRDVAAAQVVKQRGDTAVGHNEREFWGGQAT